MHLSVDDLKKDLYEKASQQRAQGSARFFKTAPGEYGEGDLFVGIPVPHIRNVARKAQHLSLKEIACFVQSPIHEERVFGFIVCVNQFKKTIKDNDSHKQELLVRFYLKNKKYLNNWDLIDITAGSILGIYFLKRERAILFKWIESKSLWDRRLALMTTQGFIRQNDFKDTLLLCQKVLTDHEDLIHKASGWMLREVGKKDVQLLHQFLTQHKNKMPRTMLRYAIEKLSIEQRKKYLAKNE